MLAKSRKLSKKKVQEDKLVTYYSKALKFYESYQKHIIIVVGIIAVVIVAFLYYNSKQKEDNLEATTEMSRVVPLYEAGSYQEAIDGRAGTNIVGFKKIIENYGSTSQGESAKIYLANSYFFLGDYENALKYYGSYSGNNKMFEAASLAGKANCYEAKGEYEKAAELFMQASDVSDENPDNPEYLLKSGINFLKVDRKEEAKKELDKIKKDYANSTSNNLADRYLAQIQ